ncbi:hypothetical protein RSOLAG22IIIB_08877 [Rhizoctonia solani]|uniref:Uncharacterized protein n=1 Tax=Rhizoctonia solani TaxID=456999 RepID=A0A0K6FUS3_9AGAM|nr:hypothetical protein RSOLAG22IIIB_08877 [Rhizoctonia solani]
MAQSAELSWPLTFVPHDRSAAHFSPYHVASKQQYLAIKYAHEVDVARPLYYHYMRHADVNKQGLYRSPNILECRLTLGVEVLVEESLEKPGTLVYLLSASTCHALSDALAQVRLCVANFVGYPEWEELEAGPESAPLYQQFADFGIAYPIEPINTGYSYMVTQFFKSLEEVHDYVVNHQIWAIFMIQSLHYLAMAKGWSEFERLKLPAEFDNHIHIALHLLAQHGVKLCGPLAPHTPPIDASCPHVHAPPSTPSPPETSSNCTMVTATPVHHSGDKEEEPARFYLPWKEDEEMDSPMHSAHSSGSTTSTAIEGDKDEDPNSETIPASNSRLVFRGAFAEDFEFVLDF